MAGQGVLGHAPAEADTRARVRAAQQYSDQELSAGVPTTQHRVVSASGAEKAGTPSLSSPDLEGQLADSPEEAEWLRAHGYPSFNDIEFMNDLSVDQLSDLAKAGNPVAQALLGTRLALAEGKVKS